MISISNRSWQKRKLPPEISQQDYQKFADTAQVPLSIIHLLAVRGLTDLSSINSFLHPSLSNLPAPSTMKDMDKAVAIIADGLQRKTPMIIYGDYDADGITSTSLLLLFLKHIGGRVSYYIPDRFTEGYGLNHDALHMLAGKNFKTDEKILITVDCGISNIQEIITAKQLGFTVIITDHHLVPDELPEADAILNPRQPDCLFPFKQLAGVGVAFYLLMGLRTHLYNNGFWSDSSIPNLKSYLDIVALGTVGDQVSP